MRNFNILLIIFVFLFTSCQSIKDGLSGKKNENSDEFLVQKKNPLVLPPKFLELPEPSNESFNKSKTIEDETNIQKILEIEETTENQQIQQGSAEDFVLRQIKNK